MSLSSIINWVSLYKFEIIIVTLLILGYIIKKKIKKDSYFSPWFNGVGYVNSNIQDTNIPSYFFTENNDWAVIKIENCRVGEVLPMVSELEQEGYFFDEQMNKIYVNDPFIILRKKSKSGGQ